LGERRVRNAEVEGSIPFFSTIHQFRVIQLRQDTDQRRAFLSEACPNPMNGNGSAKSVRFWTRWQSRLFGGMHRLMQSSGYPDHLEPYWLQAAESNLPDEPSCDTKNKSGGAT